MAQQVITVKGMGCDRCAATVRDHLTALDGVTEVTVSFAQGRAQVTFDQQEIGVQRLIQAVRQAGYEATL